MSMPITQVTTAAATTAAMTAAILLAESVAPVPVVGVVLAVLVVELDPPELFVLLVLLSSPLVEPLTSWLTGDNETPFEVTH